MKKILALLLALVMACTVFTACGGSDTPSTASESKPSQSSSSSESKPSQSSTASKEEVNDEDEEEYEDEDGYVDEYLDVMNTFVADFEDLMASLGELLALSDEIATEDDLYVWCEMFDNIKELVGEAADELANVAEYTPEEYLESHVAVTFAVAAVYDAMTGFEDAVVGAINGDTDAFESGLVDFVGNMIAADELWQSAVES